MTIASNTGGDRVAGTQSISRAFAMLRLFCSEGRTLGVVELADHLGFTLSTTHRIARALVAEGYLAQDEGRERYRIGPQSLLLGHAAQRAMGIDAARPVLEALALNTGESVNLGLPDGNHALVVDRVESSQPLRFSMETGTRIELHATSMGKALLAFNDEFAAYIESIDLRAVRLTPKTHATAADLRADLAATRVRGWSIDDEESLLGVRCVAAPVLDRAEVARAAVAVQAPAVRMPDERLAELGPLVQQAAAELSHLLPI